MRAYYFPIYTAAITFPLVALLFSLPYAIHSYRKYGSVSIWRTFILFSFIFYLQCAYYLIILPLPDPASVAGRTGPFYDLFPFTFVKTLIQESPFVFSRPGTWIQALKHRSFLEPFFNSCLLLPFGIYLAYYFKNNWKRVLLLSFLLSLFFEISQLTGLFWLYSKPYRLFSVDDLLLNSLGGLIGYFVYTRYLVFLPNREKMDRESIERNKSVSFTRRALALFLDSAVISILKALLMAFSGIEELQAYSAALIVYTIGISIITNGRTLGKMIVRIKVSKINNEGGFITAIVLRYLLRDSVILSLSFTSNMIGASVKWQTAWLAAYLAIIFASLADCFFSMRKNRQLWYERVSKTENISTVKMPSSPE